MLICHYCRHFFVQMTIISCFLFSHCLRSGLLLTSWYISLDTESLLLTPVTALSCSTDLSRTHWCVFQTVVKNQSHFFLEVSAHGPFTQDSLSIVFHRLLPFAYQGHKSHFTRKKKKVLFCMKQSFVLDLVLPVFFFLRTKSQFRLSASIYILNLLLLILTHKSESMTLSRVHRN